MSALIERRRELKTIDTHAFDEQVASLAKEIEACKGKRWLVRRARDLQTELEATRKAKQEALEGVPLQRFDDSMRPVMRRLRQAAEGRRRLQLEEAEREVRKRLTRSTDAIGLQRAAVGDMCDDCGVSMRIIANDSLLGCPQCAKTRIIPAVSAPVADTEFVSTPYAQKSRLVEWLEFCQAKEYSEPAEDVLEVIMAQLVAQRATGLEDYAIQIYNERALNGPFVDVESAIARLPHIPGLRVKLLALKATTIRAAMQSASTTSIDDRLRKFYERAPKYAAYISGFWPLRFTNSQEERIRSLYAVAVPAYEKYRKPSQPNWPGGYAYFLRCLCMLLGWDEFLDHFNVSAGQKNVQEREAMRKKIWTQDLDWEYVSCSPSVTGSKRKLMLH
jgi:hypothetical protein